MVRERAAAFCSGAVAALGVSAAPEHILLRAALARVGRTASDKPIIDGVAEAAAAAAAGDAALAQSEVLVEKNTQRFARVTARRFVLEGQLSAAEDVELKACVVFIVVRAEARALRTSNAQNEYSAPLPLRIAFDSLAVMVIKREDESAAAFQNPFFDTHSLDFDAVGVQSESTSAEPLRARSHCIGTFYNQMTRVPLPL